ncbi:TM2 domain-containing protein [Campylobacter lari]|uniref:TM2 domain-containing protein n=1 Tax=Campylobacter lari TaxID=201 RepID=UPI00057CEBBA|nr:TM2 domain-containing protein [Campylobacter lari]EAK9954323.1 TM2 domain-containing protein [Campylobacter lari]
MFLLYLKDKIPANKLSFIEEQLKHISEDKLQKLNLVKLKNAELGLILSITFGSCGVDRFYKGDWLLGCAKLSLLFLYVVFNTPIDVICVFVVLFWYITDIFLVFFGIKKDNFKKIIGFMKES